MQKLLQKNNIAKTQQLYYCVEIRTPVTQVPWY